MKVLLYGANGWIGEKIYELLVKDKNTVVKGCIRAEDQKGLEDEIALVKPTHIMSFIGRTHGTVGNTEYTTIDYLEQSGKLKENVRDNLYSPLVLAILAQKYNAHYTYMGTGCIFEYDEEHVFGEEKNGFTEEDVPNFFGSSYSTVKGYTDRLMHLFKDTALNVRIRMPITSDFSHRNFIKKITKYAKICSVPNSMTCLDELLPVMLNMAERGVTGTINLTNPGLITHNEILEMYKKYVNPMFVWKNFTVEEQSEILAAGRSNNYLDTSRLQEMYPNVMNIKDSVKICLEKMGNTP